MKKIKSYIAFLLALLLFLSISWTVAAALMPRRESYGSMWKSFELEQADSIDAMFFGSSVSYCNIIPAVIRDEGSFSAYVMSGPEQTIPISYYYMREVCKSQKPELMVLEMTGMFFDEFESYTKVNIGYMPLGLNRLSATFSAAERSELWGLLFPLYNYHYRWQELIYPPEEALPSISADICAGYTMLTESCGVPSPVAREYSAETDTYAKNLDYLGRMKSFCDENGIELLCYFAPWNMTFPQEAYDSLVADTAELGINFIDLNGFRSEMGIDDESDWYDFLHLNLFGAAKLSAWLADYISENYDIEPDAVDEKLWQQRSEHISKALAQGTK